MKEPGLYALTVHKGATLRERFTWKAPLVEGGPLAPVDLTGWSARSQLRVNSIVVLTLDSDSEAAPDGTITLGDDGTIELFADAAVASSATTGSGRWSLEVQPPDGDRDVLLEGPLTVLDEVTA